MSILDTVVKLENPTVADVLKAAKQLLSKPENWGRHYAWKDKHNIAVDAEPYNCNKVCKFCSYGAVVGVAVANKTTCSSELYQEAADYLYEVANEINPSSLTSMALYEYNDNPATTHVDILALFDKAIERATTAEGK